MSIISTSKTKKYTTVIRFGVICTWNQHLTRQGQAGHRRSQSWRLWGWRGVRNDWGQPRKASWGCCPSPSFVSLSPLYLGTDLIDFFFCRVCTIFRICGELFLLCGVHFWLWNYIFSLLDNLFVTGCNIEYRFDCVLRQNLTMEIVRRKYWSCWLLPEAFFWFQPPGDGI